LGNLCGAVIPAASAGHRSESSDLRRLIAAAENERRTVDRIRELCGNALSLRAFAFELFRGYMTKRGGRRKPETIRKALAPAA
jgi:hypothetical protein